MKCMCTAKGSSFFTSGTSKKYPEVTPDFRKGGRICCRSLEVVHFTTMNFLGQPACSGAKANKSPPAMRLANFSVSGSFPSSGTSVALEAELPLEQLQTRCYFFFFFLSMYGHLISESLGLIYFRRHIDDPLVTRVLKLKSNSQK